LKLQWRLERGITSPPYAIFYDISSICSIFMM
jgi:hypothetical protein